MKEVRKAVIVAAGLGTRMYPITKIESKLLIEIINKPIVEYIVEELADSGIKEVIIVSNHVAELKELFNKNERLNNLLKKLHQNNALEKIEHIECLCKIDLIRQDRPMGWMHEVLHSQDHVKDEPFIVCFSDVVYTSKIPAAKQLIVKFQETNKNIWANARYLFKPAVFEIAKKEKYKLGEDIADLDVLERLREGNDLFELHIEGEFHNIGDPLSYLKTQTFFGLQDKEFGEEYREFLKKLIG